MTYGPHNLSEQKRPSYPLTGWPAGGETVYGCVQAECSAALAPRGWESCQEEAERKGRREN